MFSKVEIWILYLVVLIGVLITIAFGILVRQELVGSIKLGHLSRAALVVAELPVHVKNAIKELSGETHLVAESRFGDSFGFNGKPTLNETYLLLSRTDKVVNDHFVELVDLRTFEVLHTWNPNIDQFNRLLEENADENQSEFLTFARDNNDRRQFLGHPMLTADGNLLVNAGTLRVIDKCSKLVFQPLKDIYHHSIEADTEGNIWVPTNLLSSRTLSEEKFGNFDKYSDNGITKLSRDFEVLYSKSVTEIFLENDLEYLLFGIDLGSIGFNNDPLHLNDIQPVDHDGEFWKKGDVFISLRNQSMVLLYRPSTGRIIWKGVGEFFRQHDVDILDDHRITIFDNHVKVYADGIERVDRSNRVVIFNFETNQYSLYQEGPMQEMQVRTITEGLSEVLPSGDMLIEEQNYGRLLYFDNTGQVRWSYVNRSDNGSVYNLHWARMLHTPAQIANVRALLNSEKQCE